MANMRVFAPVVFVLLALIVATSIVADMSCETIVSNLFSCLYVAEPGAPIEGTCYDGINMINEKSDREDFCSCMEPIWELFLPNSSKTIDTYPARCHVNLPYNLYCDSP